MNSTDLATVLTGLMLAGILWLVRSVTELNKNVAVLRAVLVGENGDGGGLVAEVVSLRSVLARVDALEEALQSLRGGRRK